MPRATSKPPVTDAERASAAAGALEDARGSLRDAGKFAAQGGLPLRFSSEAARLMMAVEDLEAQISEWAVR